MSRHYSMTIHVEGFDAAHIKSIQAAADEEWPGLELHHSEAEGEILFGEAENQLCGGETEVEFARRISKAIFRANHGPCTVRVDAIYLEELPYETYEYGPEDYDQVIGSASPLEPEYPEAPRGEGGA